MKANQQLTDKRKIAKNKLNCDLCRNSFHFIIISQHHDIQFRRSNAQGIQESEFDNLFKKFNTARKSTNREVLSNMAGISTVQNDSEL